MDCGFCTKDEPGHKIVCKSGCIFFSVGPEQVAAADRSAAAGANKCAARNSMRRQLETKE
jgi:hypothetical protein